MDRDEFPDEMLNAYVDGELTADEAARVARRASSDPRLARRLAVLQEIRAAVAGLAPEVVVVPLPSPRRGGARRLLTGLVAASLMLALLASTYLFLASPGDGDEEWLQLARSHDHWLAGEPLGRAVASNPGAVRYMAVAGLTQVHDSRIALPDGRFARHSGFVGAHGCRVSLFEIETGGRMPAASPIAFSREEDLHAARWEQHGKRFVMLARKMDPDRFETIAGSIRQAGERDFADDEALMAEIRAARQRCLA